MTLVPLFVLVALIFIAFVAAAVRSSLPLPCPACRKRALEAIETARRDGEIAQLHECRACHARFRKQGEGPLEKL
jgi:hypothetical protein